MDKGVFVGLTNVDIVYYGKEIPCENKKVKTNDFKTYIGGPAANAAITYSILGGKTRLITCIGSSNMGESIKESLKKDYNIDVVDIASGQNVPMSMSSIYVNDSTGSRTIWSGQTKYSIKDCRYLDNISDSKFIFSDCNLQEVSLKCLKEAYGLRKMIILDCGSWKENMDKFLSMASEIIASEDCIPPSGVGFFAEASKHNVKRVAITHGGNPIETKERNGGIGLISPVACKAKDTLGAGDIFHGAYCYFRFVKLYGFEESIKKACELATRSVAYRGPREGVLRFAQIYR